MTSLYSILWCFGAKDVAEDGRTVTINSRETEASLEYIRTLYSDAMDPAVLSWGNHPVWDVDPKYRALKGVAHYSHLYGWPAPPDERIRLVTNSYIIPSMVARVVTNVAKPKEAMVWAETAIERLVTR